MYATPRSGLRSQPVRIAAAAIVIASAAVLSTVSNARAAGGFKTPTLVGGVLTVTGTRAADTIDLRLASGDPSTFQVDVGTGAIDFNFPLAAISQIVVNAKAGDDTVRIDELNGAFSSAIPTTLDGGAGNDTLIGASGASVLNGGKGDDTLLGGSGAETLLGGAGNDLVDGNQGSDVAQLGGGNDTFQWDPGDGSDVVDGQAGSDTLTFNGSNIAEQITLSANGPRLRLTRDVAAITMDASGLEHVGLRLLGGADTLTVSSLAGTGVTSVDADLQGFAGGGDAAADRVIVNGTAGADAVHVGDTAGAVDVTGLVPEVTVQNMEPANDAVALNTIGGADAVTVDDLAAAGFARVEVDPGQTDGSPDSVVVNGTAGDDVIGLAGDTASESVFAGTGVVAVASGDALDELDVRGLDGNDQLVASSDPGGAMALHLDGGAGDDTIIGSQGADTLLGGDGNDLVDGNRGNDLALLGSGDDTFQWDPGDASDTVEGQDGSDTLQFNGSNIGEQIALSANGSRLRLTRDIAVITMDAAGMEQVNVRALGGSDTITVDDLTGTGVTGVGLDLGGSLGGGDAAPDSVIVNGTDAADSIDISGDAGAATVTGTPARVDVANAEPGSDTLTVNALGGDDAVTASNLSAADIGLIATGGDGNDVIVGGAGDDSLFGNDGDDVLIGGPGLDLLDGGSGDNVLIQD